MAGSGRLDDVVQTVSTVFATLDRHWQRHVDLGQHKPCPALELSASEGIVRGLASRCILRIIDILEVMSLLERHINSIDWVQAWGAQAEM